jgi:hypothetical protein
VPDVSESLEQETYAQVDDDVSPVAEEAPDVEDFQDIIIEDSTEQPSDEQDVTLLDTQEEDSLMDNNDDAAFAEDDQ